MSKSYFIFVRFENVFVPVDKVIHDCYYSDCDKCRREMRKRGSCYCPQSKYWYCNMDCGTCLYCCGNVNYKESTYTNMDVNPTEDAIDQTADIQWQLERKECYEHLWKILGKLDEEDQYVLAQIAQRARQQDIADKLGIPRTTMISRHKKCIAELQKNLNNFR